MTIIERGIAAVAIVAMLGGGGMFFSKHSAPVVAPATIERVEPAKPFVCTARQYEAGECEPQTDAALPAREVKPAKQVAVPAREHKAAPVRTKRAHAPARVHAPKAKPVAVGGQYKGWTCGDVKRFIQEKGGEEPAKRIAVAAGATPDEIALAKTCTQFTWRFW